MAFTDNPVVASLSSALGLGGLTSNPLATASATPRVAPAHSQPNQPEYRQARFYDPSRGGASRGTSQGTTPTEPGTMSPSTNPTVMDLLNHFGVNPTQQIDPHLFIHNADAWANHPVMSGILEGLLSGAANTHGGDTIGENISNVAQGVAATSAQRAERVNSQIMMPYQQASAVAGLQDKVDEQNLRAAQQKEAISRSHYWDDVLSNKQQISDAANETRLKGVQIKADEDLKKAQALGDARVRAAQARPGNASTQQWNNTYAAELAKLKQSPTDEETPAMIGQATQNALEKLQGPNSAATRSKIVVKNAAPGSSAAAMISANKNGDAQTSAAYKDADKDLQWWKNAKPSQKAAALGKPVVPGDSEDQAELQRRTAIRDAARNKLPGGSKTASQPTYSSTNPFAQPKN